MTDALEQYRPYLTLLARIQLDPALEARIDAADIVQETLSEAYATARAFRGKSEAEMAGWLRQILAHNLADALRALHRGKRDIGREQSLEQRLATSSARLQHWLAADQSSPSQHAQRQERAVRLAQSLAELAAPQREAIVLQYWHGWSLAQIGQKLDRSTSAVAGLLRRGLLQLRKSLDGQGVDP
jgi:RNA polymerase sigma-70 factor (ECF subfamily)